ncbi:MAG: hypothetical protein EA394_09100 [Bacteroidia bacterium]|nr:MAG: hypothetical protein EA394_09100 [Bacteroidia bacterium]
MVYPIGLNNSNWVFPFKSTFSKRLSCWYTIEYKPILQMIRKQDNALSREFSNQQVVHKSLFT